MAKQFTVKILPSEEFEKLPFKRIQENPGSVFGAADHRTGIAFVRDTGFDDFTKMNIEHELDELMATTSAHEEDGIRYKDFSQSFGNFGGSIPGIGGLLGPILGAVGQVPDLLGAGASKIGGLFKGGGGAAPASRFSGGSGGGAAATTSNTLGRTPTDFGSAFRLPSILGSQAGGPSVGGQSSLPGFAGGSITPSRGGASGGIESLLDIFSGGGGGGGFSPPQPLSFFEKAGGVAKGFGKNIMSGLQTALSGDEAAGRPGAAESIGKAIPGTAIQLLGNLFSPKVDPIDTSGIRSDLESKIRGTDGQGGPLLSEALDVGRNILTTDPGDPNASQFLSQDRIIDEQLADSLQNLSQTFQALNPGANVENNSSFVEQKARLQRDAATAKAEARGNAVAQQIQDQIRVFEDVLNIDSAQTQQFIKLAQLELEELMLNTGLQEGEAREFKSLFGGVGEALLSSQFPNLGQG